MAQIPLSWSVEGDYEARMIAVDSEDTMDEVAKAIGAYAVGKWVPEQPDKTMRVRVQGQAELLPRQGKVKDHLKYWQCVEVVFE
jgi:toluene monooxygenase system protein B